MYKLSVYVQAYILIKTLKNLPKALLYFFFKYWSGLCNTLFLYFVRNSCQIICISVCTKNQFAAYAFTNVLLYGQSGYIANSKFCTTYTAYHQSWLELHISPPFWQQWQVYIPQYFHLKSDISGKIFRQFPIKFWTIVVIHWDRMKTKSKQNENANSYRLWIIFGRIKCCF